KKAAMEMQERLFGLIGVQATSVAMGTFHSIFFGILREHWEASGNKLRYAKKITFKQTRWFVDEASS
ncbi:MAG: UvrD-helicase domain-containing protein, partial [Candidatus Acidiferrales bacterium]